MLNQNIFGKDPRKYGVFTGISPSLRKIDGTEIVPLEHCLMVCNTVPFGALFWCHFAKGHRFCLPFPYKYKNSSPRALIQYPFTNSALFSKTPPFSTFFVENGGLQLRALFQQNGALLVVRVKYYSPQKLQNFHLIFLKNCVTKICQARWTITCPTNFQNVQL